MLLREMKIGRRAGCIFAFLAAMVLAMGLASLFETRKMDAATTEIRDTWLPAVLAMGEIGTQLGRGRALTSNSLLLTDAGARRDSVAGVEAVIATITPQMDAYERTIINAEDRQLFDNFAAAYKTYHAQQEVILKAVLDDRLSYAERLLNGDNAKASDAMVTALTALITFNSEGALAASQRSSDTSDEAFLVAFIALAAIMATMLGTAVLLTRSIVTPLSEAVAVAERVASGDLSRDIHFSGHDEPALLMGAMQRMQNNLRNTLQQIANASDQLASASEELHAVTEDASRGLQQQSNEIEQAATAVNEMTTAVEEVANNAVITSQASQGADKTTQQGRGQVAQALQSIQHLAGDVTATSKEIEALAQNVNQISKVLEVIGAIADQTNLLALNAAIEAARAGDAGRGFAVVADEVRALAHRTRQSTEEIEQMIHGIQAGTERAVSAMQNSNERTNGTLQVAQAAGEALDAIAREISAINERNLLIASASEQQAQVAREVDRNLVNIRDLSIQTTTGAHQSSAASQDLSRLASDLNTMVARFRF